MKSFLKSYWAALLWAAFILLLCSLPGEDLPNIDFWEINIEDKLAHVFVFTVLSIFMVRGALDLSNLQSKTKVLATISLIGMAYGGLIEILQGWLFPTRFASFFDFIADSIGAILGTVFAYKYFTNRKG